MILWVGKEQEGEHSGMLTLFVGSPEITFTQIDTVLKTYTEIKQIYFGAGICTKINNAVLSEVIYNYNEQYIITVEVLYNKIHKVKKRLLQRVNLIITFNSREFVLLDELDLNRIQIKTQNLKGNNILIISKAIQKVDMNKLNGKVYENDEVLI